MKHSVWLTGCIIGLFLSSVFAQTSTSVETTKVVSQVLDKTVTIPGDLTPYQGVNLNARVTGFVESIAVDRGSWVKRGQLLGKLSAPELRAQRLEAEAKLQGVRAQEAEAEAKTAAAQSTYDRLKAASATPGVVAGHDVEIAQRSLEAARAHVNALKGSGGAAEAAVKAVAEMEAYLQLTAPFDGVITERTCIRAAWSAPRLVPCSGSNKYRD
jgi:membrane fusion protein, multidrug efflux system